MVDAVKPEVHSFDADDDYTGQWGLWDYESCCLCGKRLIVVAPLYDLPEILYCGGCDPYASEVGVAG